MRKSIVFGLGLMVGVIAIGVSALQRRADTHQDEVAPGVPVPFSNFQLAAADSSGVIIVSSLANTIEGVGRQGRTLWTMPLDPMYFSTVCWNGCPNAVFSGPIAAFGAPEIADSDVVWKTEYAETMEPAGIPNAGPGKSLVWAATSPDRQVVWRSDLKGNAHVLFRDRPNADLAIQVGLGYTSVATNETVDGAIVVEPGDEHGMHRYHWVKRAESGWVEIATGTTLSPTVCIDSDGMRGSFIGASSVLIDRRRSSESISLPGVSGSCVFTRIGPVIVGSASSESGSKTTIAQYTNDGELVWSHDVDGSLTATADETAGLVALGGPGFFAVYDELGAIVESASEVSGGMLVGGKMFVVLDANGSPSWGFVDQ